MILQTCFLNPIFLLFFYGGLTDQNLSEQSDFSSADSSSLESSSLESIAIEDVKFLFPEPVARTARLGCRLQKEGESRRGSVSKLTRNANGSTQKARVTTRCSCWVRT